MKRVFDVVASASALLALSPLLAVIGIAVKISSPGPVLFRHVRVGQGFEEFPVLKFRTMSESSGGMQITAAGDARITPVGRLLRQYKFDELPQLVNVLRGEMSVVGPRPEVAKYVDLIDDYREVLKVRPGLTDPASLTYRHEQELLDQQSDPESYYEQELLPSKVALSLGYVRTQSFFGDLALIYKTIKAISK